jgi:diguanylate cyclase (GGDEF)-like protein
MERAAPGGTGRPAQLGGTIKFVSRRPTTIQSRKPWRGAPWVRSCWIGNRRLQMNKCCHVLLRGAVTLLAACAAMLSASAFAGQPAMSFARLGAAQGLSQGAIMSILQDQRGFLWLGTEDGLNRYDGSELRHYLHKRTDPASVPSNYIAALAQDRQGRMWVGTDGGGLAWRDPASGVFRRPLSASGQMLIDPMVQIRSMYVDRRQQLWLATRASGLVLIDPEAGTARDFRRDLTDPNSLGDDSVFAVAEDSSGQIWVGTATGLDRLDPESATAEHFGPRLSQLAGAGSTPVRVTSVYIDSRGTVWVGSDRGLFRLDVAAASLSLLRHKDGDEGSLPSDKVTALLEDSERRLWVGTTGGLALLDRRAEKFTTFHNEPANAASLPEDHILSLYQDRSGLLWVGTKSGGVARWNPRSWAFGHYQFREPERNNVSAFGVDSRGTLWLGSFGGGLAAIDRRSGAVRWYGAGPGSPISLADAAIMALAVDEKDRIWFGTMNAGVERFDPASGKVHHFKYDPNDNRSLPAAGVMSLLRGARGTIWVGTYGGGLARIDPDRDTVFRYPISRQGSAGLSSDRATALAEDPAGLIWVGTDGGGLNVLDPSSGRIRHFLHDPTDASSLSSNTVYSVHIDERGRVWVGTRGGGLDRVVGNPFSLEGMHFSNLSESDGLPNSTIYGIESDASGRLWLSTNRGLTAFNPEDRSIRNFRPSHGLQGDEFNFGAHYRGADGTVYFGGPNGYNAFLPEGLHFNMHPPQVALIELLKLNTPLAGPLDALQGIELGYRDNVVTIRFAALDYTGPQENHYQYRLDGFDREWIDAGNRGQATYTNLNAGHYLFRVRAANSDGYWNSDGLRLAVQVAPAPWATWWAMTLYVAALLMLLGGLWLIQRQRIEREAAYARRLQAEVDQRTAELAERNRQMQAANLQLREVSVTDPMTGLGNRRCLRDAMHAFTPADKASNSVLMIVDLDYLKPINDQYGHDGGDAVLVRLAELLRHFFRSSDLIVRWGGDEFVVLCRNCDLNTASTLAERMRSAIAKTIFRVGEGAVARTSCSIGFAALPFVAGAPQLFDWEQSMNLADAALYRAKQQRNNWFGWGGKPAAAEVPGLVAAVEADAAALEQQGLLDVRRRPAESEDTVDQLNALAQPDAR